jgi:exodeoxyribonuclease VII large subunit
VKHIYSVADLNQQVRELIEQNFPLIWVTGEISNLSRPASGHIYFTLKDEAAQVRCAMFRMRNALLNFQPTSGAQVLLRAKVGLYEARGDYQLIVEHMEAAGDGLLRQRFDALKLKLKQQGLFDNEHKQGIPSIPSHIGVITSPSGAAIKDVISVLKRRFPAIPVLIYPTLVQGAGAAEQIAHSIIKANQHKTCDVLILTRGGGSLEDLWAFNEEIVARSVYESTIPIVTGVGHEIDFTIADFVADQRAATPSAAAELISPDRNDWLETLEHLKNRTHYSIRTTLQKHRQSISGFRQRLKHPGQNLRDQSQRLDELEERLGINQRHYMRNIRAQVMTLKVTLQQFSPQQKLRAHSVHCQTLANRLFIAEQHGHDTRQGQLSSLARALENVSPLATLGRGYAIVKTQATQQIVRHASELKPDELIETTLGQGSVVSQVKQIQTKRNSDI